MSHRFSLMLAMGSLASLSPGMLRGQCLDADHFSADLLAYATVLAASSESVYVETRELYAILPVDMMDVERVERAETCKRAGREYHQTLKLRGEAPAVHVIRIGTRYIVMNPSQRVGEFIPFVVFDERFNELAVFVE